MLVLEDQWETTPDQTGLQNHQTILVGIGMFTGGTIWILTHGHMFPGLGGAARSCASEAEVVLSLVKWWGREASLHCSGENAGDGLL